MPTPLQPLAEYVPTQCPPSAGRVRAGAAPAELGAAESPGRAGIWGRASRGIGPVRPLPEGEGGIGLLWAIPGEIRCAGAREEGEQGSGPDLCVFPRRKLGVPGPFSPVWGRRAGREAVVGLSGVLCVLGARQLQFCSHLPQGQNLLGLFTL